MELFYREKGCGHPLIILHGLWGASENWFPVANLLADDYRVIMPDIRNHGMSPHSPEHNYEVLSDDISHFIEQLHLAEKPHIIGHSMGGKIVMALLLRNPGIADKAIIIDIAPVSYPPSPVHQSLFRFINTLNPELFADRKEILSYIREAFPDERTQQLLMKNLQKTEKGIYQWKINTQALYDNQEALSGWPDSLRHKIYDKKILFIKGEKSDYIPGPEEIKNNFPAAVLTVVPGAGHWVHTDQPENLAREIKQFLR